MELKEGYKQTEVGVLPEGWSISELIKVASIFGRIGFRGYTKNDIVSKGEGAISLGPSNILDNQLSFEKTTYISWAKYDESPEIKVSEQDVLLVKTGSTGKTCLAKNLLQECTINPQLVILKPKANKIDARLLSAFVSAPLVQSQIEETVVGGVLSTLSQREIGSFKLPLPPIEEQRAIAVVLSDVDAEIESLARRHEKLVNQKQGLSEELLSGRIRLVEPKSSGFKQTDVGVIPEDWEIKQIKEVASLSSGGTPSRSRIEYFDGTIPWLSISDISRSDKFIYATAEQITEEALLSSSARDFPLGTIMLAMYASIGKVAISTGRISCSQAILGIVPNPMVARDYFYYFLLNHQAKFISLGQQGTQSNLNKAIVSETRIPLPSIIEQQAIAEVLSDVDAEIQAVAKLKAKVQAKKEGLMQTLLTGKIRLT